MLPRTIPDLNEKQWEQVEELARRQTPENLEKARVQAKEFLQNLKHE